MTRGEYIMEKDRRTPLEKGTKLKDSYIVECLIGEGGTSLVYRGRNENGIYVIIKELYPLIGKKIERNDTNALCIPQELMETFRNFQNREKEVYEISRRLLNDGRTSNNPHSWTYIDSFEENNSYYQVCQDISGKSLQEAIKDQSISLNTLSDYISIGLNIIPAIRSLHEQGYVHTDLNPANLFVVEAQPNVFFRCIDFGSSVKVGESRVFSTSNDIAPPEIGIDSRGMIIQDNPGEGGIMYDYDTYAILAILYKLLIGTSPKERPNKSEDMFFRKQSELFNVSDEALEIINTIFSNGLARTRELRYESLDALEADLLELQRELKKEVYIESVGIRDVSPMIDLRDDYAEIYEYTMQRDVSISFFKIKKERDAFFACAQLFSYCRNKRYNLRIIPITYRKSLKETLNALPFGFGRYVQVKDERKILELKNIGEEYCIIILGYKYDENDKGILNDLKANKEGRFWFFGSTKFEGKYDSLPSDDDYAISTTGKGVLKYFEVAGNYGISKLSLENLDDVVLDEVEGLCQNGTLWRFGHKIYCSPEVFPFVRAEDEEDEEGTTRRVTIVKLLEAIISCAEDEEYKAMNQYQSLSVSDFQLSMFLLKQLPCEKRMSELLSKLYNCCDKDNFRGYLLEGYKEIFEKFLPSDVVKEKYNSNSKNAYILGSNYVEFCELVERGGDRKEELRKYKYILHEISKYPELMLKSSMEAKNYEKVIEVATMLIEWFSYSGNDYKNSIDAYYEMRAKAYYQKEEYSKAIDDYTELIEKRDKKTFHTYRERAKAYGVLKNFGQAEADCLKAIEINPYNATGFSTLGFIQVGQEKWKEAENSVSRALEINCEEVGAWSCKGIIYRVFFKDYLKAEEVFRKVCEIVPNISAYRAELVTLQIYQEKWEEAEKNCKKACELSPNKDSYFIILSKIQMKMGKWEEAEKNLDKAIKLDSQKANTWGYKGYIYKQLGKYREAEEYYKRACEIAPNESLYFVKLSLVQMKQKKWEEAEISLTKSLAKDSENIELLKAMGDLWLDREDKGIWEKNVEAEKYYMKVIKQDSTDIQSYIKLGNVQLYLFKLVEGKKTFRDLLTIDKECATAWKGLGDICVKLRDYKEALICYEKVSELDPTNEEYKEDVKLVKEELGLL